MTQDDRDIIETLKSELNFIEKGGYGRSVRSPWEPTSIFEDSPICLNYADPQGSHPCSQCLLIDFVPPENRNKPVPCHHIPISTTGETIDDLEWVEDRHGLEESLKDWLRVTITRLEEQSATPANA